MTDPSQIKANVNPVWALGTVALHGDIERNFALLAENGYDGVDLIVVEPDPKTGAGIRKLAEKYKLTVSCLNTGKVPAQTGLTLTDPDESVRKAAIVNSKQIIDFAHEVGEAGIAFGQIRGRYLDGVDRKLTYDYAVEAFRTLSDYAEPRYVMLTLESINKRSMNFINSIADGVEMVGAVGRDYFQMMMDTEHMHYEDDTIPTILKYGPKYLHQVHLSDTGRSCPGTGEIDFDAVIGAFRQAGYDGGFEVEFYQKPDPVICLKEAMDFLEPIFSKHYGWKKNS